MGFAPLSKRNGHPQTAGYDSNYLAPVRRSHNSFSQAERIVVMNTIQGAEMSDQEVLKAILSCAGHTR